MAMMHSTAKPMMLMCQPSTQQKTTCIHTEADTCKQQGFVCVCARRLVVMPASWNLCVCVCRCLWRPSVSWMVLKYLEVAGAGTREQELWRGSVRVLLPVAGIQSCALSIFSFESLGSGAHMHGCGRGCVRVPLLATGV